jgi:hypothetical protein
MPIQAEDMPAGRIQPWRKRSPTFTANGLAGRETVATRSRRVGWGSNDPVLLQSKWDNLPARISYNFERRFPMSKKIRKRFTAQEKVAILRLHLLERTPNE